MKQIFLLCCSILLLLFNSCDPTDGGEQKNAGQYFDLKGYIHKEAVRLQQKNGLVDKTVSIDGSKETKSVNVADWTVELSALNDADINKASWKGLFTVKALKNQVTYQSANEKVPVKMIRIRFEKGIPTLISVVIKNSNLLYSSEDSLIYRPDSLYELRKEQHIKLLSPKKYRISLKFD